MIPTTATEEIMSRYVDNIISVWNNASDDQLAHGRMWYRVAHDLAEMLAGDARKGAGVLAALSPQQSWETNVGLAGRAFTNGSASGHMGDALRKANRIMAGERPEDVLPMSSKTGHFYLCIADPTDDRTVCVDRHAHDIAVGFRFGGEDRGLSAKRRYNTLADAYRRAAEKLNELPQTVQAVTWVTWRENEASS